MAHSSSLLLPQKSQFVAVRVAFFVSANLIVTIFIVILYLGRYAYVGAKPTNAQVARLVSPLISVSLATTKCLIFWYNMYGPSVGSLNVYAKTSSLGSPIWSRNGTQGNQWHQAIGLEIQKNQSFSVSLKGGT